MSPAVVIGAVVSAAADMFALARAADESSAADTAHRIARRAVSLGLDLIPVEELRELLTEEDARRANAIADAAEALKFGVRAP